MVLAKRYFNFFLTYPATMEYIFPVGYSYQAIGYFKTIDFSLLAVLSNVYCFHAGESVYKTITQMPVHWDESTGVAFINRPISPRLFFCVFIFFQWYLFTVGLERCEINASDCDYAQSAGCRLGKRQSEIDRLNESGNRKLYQGLSPRTLSVQISLLNIFHTDYLNYFFFFFF